jgi:HPt (histidine-containing phosphotransfer) domain-containing protein
MNDTRHDPGRAATLDPAALAALRELDPDGRRGVVANVLGVYEKSLQRMLVLLTAQLEAGAVPDADAMAQLAHKMRSSSASVGATSLAAACATVEKAIRGGGTEPLADQVRWLRDEAQAALAAVGAMLRPHDASA